MSQNKTIPFLWFKETSDGSGSTQKSDIGYNGGMGTQKHGFRVHPQGLSGRNGLN